MMNFVKNPSFIIVDSVIFDGIMDKIFFESINYLNVVKVY